MTEPAVGAQKSPGPSRVHPGHEFEGFQIEQRSGRAIVVARCACGSVLDVADAAFARCPECDAGGRPCPRCGATGQIIDHAALRWRPPDEEEARDADNA
jgi:hypothetical protein